MSESTRVPPAVIQGGVGVAVSGWLLASAVADAGSMGVVSGTALEVVCARRLQLGDPGGDVRRALASFPDQAIARRVEADYFVPGGKPVDRPFKNVTSFSVDPARGLVELTVVASFVEVFLAKEGHDGPVGINFLRKIEMPLVFGLYGAMLAGVERVPYKTPSGNIGYRCPAEPVRAYSEIKGGRTANTDDRVCLCNGLLATAGLAQQRNSGYVEPPVVTGGADYRAVADLTARRTRDGELYTARDVIHYLTRQPPG